MSDALMTIVPVLEAYQPLSGFRPRLMPQHEKADQRAGTEDFGERDAVEIEVDLFALGLAEGQSLASAAFDLERAQFRALLAGADALQAESSEELAVLIAETVERLVCDIVGEIHLGRDQLLARASRAASLIAECDAARTLWVHPNDLGALQSCDLGLQLMADPEAEHGSMRVDCSHGWIEHGTSLYLRELRAQLGLKEGDL
jgi:flagellar assembly protein FliH